ncbi:transmembrane protein [Legionella hackeliae]|nr:transmembrane protein [Legionella hackeliae]
MLRYSNTIFLKRILAFLWLGFMITTVFAGAPLWTFEPLTDTKIKVPANGTAIVQYRVTNQSRKTHTLTMQPMRGIRQITSGLNVCRNPFILRSKNSCILSLQINGSQLKRPITDGPVVCQQGNLNQCYRPSAANTLDITKGPLVDYTVGGSVFGLSGTLVLENNGDDALTINADGTFSFSHPLPPGSIYLVTVQSQPANQTCTVTNGSGTITNANITNVTVNCSINTRTVGGSVSGLAASQSVVLQNNGSDNLTVNSNGSFTFSTPVAQGATYNVTVLTQPSTQTCTVTNGSGTAGASNITNVQVTCATNAYTVGGTVSGLSGTVVLQNNGGDNLMLNSNGSFTFNTPVAQGAPYSVTVFTQPTGQTCSVTNGSGTIGGTNVTNVGVNCVTNTTTLSASASQLALSVKGLTEFGVAGTPSSGLARVITITNTGSNTAVNLAVTPPTWPTGTTNSTTCGSTLAASSSCTITITPGATATSDGTNPCSSGTAPVPGGVQVSADNATTVSSDVVVLGYGCVYQGGYVYAFDDTTPNTGSVGGKVATTSDQADAFPNGIVWSSNGGTGGGSGGSDLADTSYDTLPGIDNTSTSATGSPTYATFASFFSITYTNANPFTSASFSMCNGALDGSCNTENILTFYNQFITNNTLANGGTAPFTASTGPTNITYYAAGLCKQTIAGYSDWYLPAICEMGYGSLASGCGTSSTPTLQNIQSSLIDSSGLSSPDGIYWSSSESSGLPGRRAWYQAFSSGGGFQATPKKGSQNGVRCSRALTL